MKIFVTSNDDSVRRMFQERGHTIVEDFNKDFDLMCMPGGADVTPLLYGERCLDVTHCHFPRDMEEIKYWKHLDPKFPKVGICRGAQLGNVLCGGRLWQDVDKHERGYHPLCVDHEAVHHFSKERWMVNSVHHQMCRLTSEAQLIATAARATKLVCEDEEIEYDDAQPNEYHDVEAFYYPNFDFFGVQWHPEYDHKESEKLFFLLLDAIHTKQLDSQAA